MSDRYVAHTQLRQGIEERPTTSEVDDYLKNRDKALSSGPSVWEAEGVSETYFSALEDSKDRIKDILGITDEEADSFSSGRFISEELRDRYIALIAFGTFMFEKGLSIGATDKDAMSEPTDDEVFPDPWSQDARTEIQ